MHRIAPALVLLAGCDWVFGLERHERALPADAQVPDMTDGPPASFHDEDEDDVDDSFDVCPNIFDPDQRDGDGDGVGDVCDPRPVLTGERRHYFSRLRDFTGWTAVAGQWIATGDEVRLMEATGNQLAYLAGPPVVNPTVIAVITDPKTLGSVVLYGVMIATVEPTVPFPAGVACYVHSGTGALYLYENRQQASAMTAPFSPVAPVTVRMAYTPECKGVDANGVTATPGGDSDPVVSGWPALYGYDGGAVFKSVFVVSTGDDDH